MASNLGFVEYVCEQLGGAGEIAYRKMMGDYCIYCNGKVIGDICDDRFLLKPTGAGLALYPNCVLQPPYDGAKPYILVEDVDDKEFLEKLVTATSAELTAPKPKKR